MGKLPVITGFIGATPDGETTTLGRGGSDLSAGVIASCLGSDELWIWTDVDGVMTADPRVVPSARTIEAMEYREGPGAFLFRSQGVAPAYHSIRSRFQYAGSGEEHL